jgi:hypothetical protein
MPAAIRSLNLSCPANIRLQYPEIVDGWFDADGYFKILATPDSCSFNDEYLIESKYEPTFRRLRKTSAIEVLQRGYTISVKDSRAGHFYLVEELSKQNPIQVKDFLRPERADYNAAKAAIPRVEPYTIRTGTISQVKPTSGMVGNLEMGFAYQGGFSFLFTEDRVR